MQSIDLVVESDVEQTTRVQQLAAIFDVPPQEKLRHEWKDEIPIDEREWQVGLIVGASGTGKTQIARQLFGKRLVDRRFKWPRDKACIDAFREGLGMQEITDALSAVGFNTIPSWMKPFHVLSNGEQFRAELGRRILEDAPTAVCDEFTSVVDRQVAKATCHALQKFIRRLEGRRFVAVSCHHDIVDWLRPDWVYEPARRKFDWGCLQQGRPELRVTVGPVDRAVWPTFAPFHYLTAQLHRGARCWGLWLEGELVAFCGMLVRPHGKTRVMGCSRIVTLPDYQGLGLAFVLLETVASCYRALGYQVHNYPAHPPFIRAHDRSPRWEMRKPPGSFPAAQFRKDDKRRSSWRGRPCAVFRYHGDVMERDQAETLVSFWKRSGIAS